MEKNNFIRLKIKILNIFLKRQNIIRLFLNKNYLNIRYFHLLKFLIMINSILKRERERDAF
jgi:hypothetical protein